ncbi:MAG: phenylpropionate dioxygenase, partial [Deltaproteobacteria bacterium]|nr:phenylpropionate dioxygenase [Deltaproteobacteria bacterium]
NDQSQAPTEGAWLSENRKSLEMRVKRLLTPGSLSEDPPSRTRHFVSNIRVREASRQTEVEIYSNLLLYRTRGNSSHFDLFSAERKDLLRRIDGHWKLARRHIQLDHTMLSAQDLSIFL